MITVSEGSMVGLPDLLRLDLKPHHLLATGHTSYMSHVTRNHINNAAVNQLIGTASIVHTASSDEANTVTQVAIWSLPLDNETGALGTLNVISQAGVSISGLLPSARGNSVQIVLQTADLKPVFVVFDFISEQATQIRPIIIARPNS